MTDPTDNFSRLIGYAFPAMVSGRVLGAAISPLLFAHLPPLLIAMSPFLIHLVAVAPLVDPVVYFPIALVVTILQALIGFYFGNRFGQKALDWVMERVPVPEKFVDWLLDLVRRTSMVAVFTFPGPVVATVAGVAGMRPKLFNWLVVPAQAFWVVAAYLLGEALFEYIAIAREFVVAYAIELTGLTAALVGARLAYKFWRKQRRR